MTIKILRDMLNRAEAWPEAAQNELAEAALDIEAGLASDYQPTAEDIAGIERGLKAAGEDRIASDEAVEAIFAKFQRMRIRFTDEALSDLIEIADFLIANDPLFTPEFEHRLRAVVAHITRQEQAAVAGCHGVRVAPLGRYPYKLFYQVTETGFEILHIHRGIASWPLDTLRTFRTHSDWKNYFSKLHPRDVGALCNAAMTGQLGIPQRLTFYSAVIDRLRDIGYMSIATTEEERLASIEYAASILSYVEKLFAEHTEAIEHLTKCIRISDDFYSKYGTEPRRRFLFDIGLIDKFGAELDQPR